MFNPNSLFYSDGYKVGHKRMLAQGTDFLYGTWIPRSLKYIHPSIKSVVSAGQALSMRWLHDEFTENFFDIPIEKAMQFGKDMSMYLGTPYDAEHFRDLHKLGYLPIKVKSLPEGIETPANIPHMTFINTKPGFAWLTLYLETIISSLSWKSSTSATLALQFRRKATEWVMKTDPDNAWFIDLACHDFSSRGLDPFSSYASGLGHAMSFKGSDSLIVIPAARYFYGEPEDECAIMSVNASEHSVSTTKIATVGEKQMLADWMNEFPGGILSVVMDTLDITRVVKPNGYLEELKSEVLARDGKLVIRPDSAPSPLSPVEIICGYDGELTDRMLEADYPEFYKKGLIQCLWEIFGGTTNEQGFKVLDSHIGAIYGDSINLERQREIYSKLAAKGFAATNIVLGVGSFTYQFNTRDTMGFAAKGACFESNGEGINIMKDPVTDDGTKKSLKGLITVHEDFTVTQESSKSLEDSGMLQVIYEDGNFSNMPTLKEIRKRIEAIS